MFDRLRATTFRSPVRGEHARAGCRAQETSKRPTIAGRVEKARSGYNKGTIRSDLRYLVVSKDVRRHRLISNSYISRGRCHGRGREFEARRPRHIFQSLTANPEKNLGPFGSNKRSKHSARRAFPRTNSRTRPSAPTTERELICLPTANRPARWHPPACLAPSVCSPALPEDTCSSHGDCCDASSRGS